MAITARGRLRVLLSIILLALAPESFADDSAGDAAAAAVDGAEAEVENLLQHKQLVGESMESMNATNPMSESFDPAKDPRVAAVLTEARKYLGGPTSQRLAWMLSDAEFIRAAQEIRAHPNLNGFLGSEAVWFILTWVLRLWRSAATRPGRKGLLKRIWIRFWVNALWILGAAVMIPWFVFGEPWRVVLQKIFVVFDLPQIL